MQAHAHYSKDVGPWHHLPSCFLPDHKHRLQAGPSYQLLQAPHLRTRRPHWLLLRHCSGPLGSAVPLGQPLSKHLCLEDFELGSLLRLGRRMTCMYGTDEAALTRSLGRDPAPKGRPLTVISPFFLASFINFFLFFFPLKAKSNSCRALATRMRREHEISGTVL